MSHEGTVVSVSSQAGARRLVIENARVSDSETPGASVNVNGVCLTVVHLHDGKLEFDVVPETLSRTNLGSLETGDVVNLEPSLRLGDPLGGHIVYGHVDATTTIEKKLPEGPGFRMWCSVPASVRPMIVAKGYVALDGVSLTVAEVNTDRTSFAVALIPETLARTRFGSAAEGDVVNLEVDPVARYVAALLPSKG
ncbi:MAG TPA: riboflavin synthase [Candidatus Eremiobacteraceae bacterium]|nr:riboflavin synthase [Candidatus Eremiobacteraceae bacterium]